jgi:chemotaxis protein CheC
MTEHIYPDPAYYVLHQVFQLATDNASTAMCRWTHGLVTLSLDHVDELPLESVSEALEVGDELLTMVVLTLDGEDSGQLIITFDEVNGRRLAASLLHREVCPEPDWTELEKSALTETGNILACAYLGALTRLVDTELVPSPPQFVQDFGASVLEQALLSQAIEQDRVLICRTGFHRDGQNLNWNVIFVPGASLRIKLESAAALAE